MSNWTSISKQDVYDYLAADQVDALSSEALGEEQDDPLPTVIADVAQRIRAEVGGNSANTLDPIAGTIPPELRGAALALIIEAAQARIPSLTMSSDQIRLANTARTLLQRVASGKVAVSAGIIVTDDDGEPVEEPESTVGKIELLGYRDKPLSSSSLAGI
jgi:hypothetical protein